MSRRTLSWAFVALSLTLCGGLPTIHAPRGPQSVAAETRSAPTATTLDSGSCEPTPPPIAPELRDVRAVTYSPESAITWPLDYKRRQVVFVVGAEPGTYHAWLIADGTRVGSVFFLRSQEDVNSLLGRMTRSLFAVTQSTPLDGASWGIAGTIVIPDPPPQGPGGFPDGYIQRVMDTAWYFDHSTLQTQAPTKL